MKAQLVLGNLKREREALNGKLERLSDALCKEWQDEDQEYLCTQQYNAMSLYAHILDERIADIEYKLERNKAKDENVSCKDACCNKSIFNEKVDMENCPKEMYDNIDSPEVIIQVIRDFLGYE